MKKGGPREGAARNASNLPHLHGVSKTVPQVPICRVRGVWVFLVVHTVSPESCLIESAEDSIVKQRDGGVVTSVHIFVVNVVLFGDPCQSFEGEKSQVDIGVVDDIDVGVDHKGKHNSDKAVGAKPGRKYGNGAHVKR